MIDPAQIAIYHITDVENLPAILSDGGLHSDSIMASRNPSVKIGYDHIKLRRLTEIKVACCLQRYVGEFVPFYFCPRSPMLLAINSGKTGRPAGSQRSVIHLVSTVSSVIQTQRRWAVSSGNAGAYHTTFDDQMMAVATLDWDAINATQWQGRQHQKQAEMLVAEFFPWSGFNAIGCHNSGIAGRVTELLASIEHRPSVCVKPAWYYS